MRLARGGEIDPVATVFEGKEYFDDPKSGVSLREQSRALEVAMSEGAKTSIAPMLSVRNGPKAVDFYQTAFGAKVLFRLDNGGSVVARLAVDGAEFWVADESPEHANFSPETLGGGTVRMVMIVDDPDGAFDRAVAAGAKVVVAVGNDYGWRLGRVVDPYGHHWEIGKPDETASSVE